MHTSLEGFEGRRGVNGAESYGIISFNGKKQNSVALYWKFCRPSVCRGRTGHARRIDWRRQGSRQLRLKTHLTTLHRSWFPVNFLLSRQCELIYAIFYAVFRIYILQNSITRNFLRVNREMHADAYSRRSTLSNQSFVDTRYTRDALQFALSKGMSLFTQVLSIHWPRNDHGILDTTLRQTIAICAIRSKAKRKLKTYRTETYDTRLVFLCRLLATSCLAADAFPQKCCKIIHLVLSQSDLVLLDADVCHLVYRS